MPEADCLNDSFGLKIALTFPKNDVDANEDSFSKSTRLSTFAISDGASVSFAPRLWSAILSQEFVRTQDHGSLWLTRAFARFEREFDRENLPWMQQAAYDQGTFATLLGIRLSDSSGEAQLFAVGDTLAVLCSGTTIVSSFPYSTSNQFNSSPTLISTIRSKNRFMESEGSSRSPYVNGIRRKLLIPASFA